MRPRAFFGATLGIVPIVAFSDSRGAAAPSPLVRVVAGADRFGEPRSRPPLTV